jgi:hypothetical protein
MILPRSASDLPIEQKAIRLARETPSQIAFGKSSL